MTNMDAVQGEIVGEPVCARCDLPMSQHRAEPVRVRNARTRTGIRRTTAVVCPEPDSADALRSYALRVLPLLPRES